jgi:hypothetical protein
MTRRISPVRRRPIAAATVTALLAALLLGPALPAAASALPIDGPRTSGDALFPNVGNGGYDAIDYDLDLTWSPTSRTGTGPTDVVTGVFDAATMTMTAHAPAPLRTFSLDFEGLQVADVLVDGQPAAWSRDVDPAAVLHKLIVTPATPVVGDFTVTVHYGGAPQSHVDATGSASGWTGTNDGALLRGGPVGAMTAFPHNNTPRDTATYTITVDAPTTLTGPDGVSAPAAVASNGQLVSTTLHAGGDRTTWTWRQEQPMASALVVIGIGRYEVVEGSVVLTDGRRIPSWSFIDAGLPEPEKATVRRRIAELQPITQNLETLFGPYPGTSTGVIVKAMPALDAFGTQDRPVFPSATAVDSSALVQGLAHQWQGGNGAPASWGDSWIDQGLAAWTAAYYGTTEGFGADATPSDQVHFAGWDAALGAEWNTPAGAQTDPSTLFSPGTAARGAQFWAALRVAIGDDAFFELVRQWPVANAGQSRTGDQLKALATRLSGRDLGTFWSDWVLEPGKPAWPDRSTITLTSDAVAPVAPGDAVTFVVRAANTGRVPLASTTVTLDLAALTRHATVSLPKGVVVRDGSEVRWTVPATPVGETSRITFTATLRTDAEAGRLSATAASRSLGSTCATCAVTIDAVGGSGNTPAPSVTDAPVGAVRASVTSSEDASASSGTGAVAAAGTVETASAADAGFVVAAGLLTLVLVAAGGMFGFARRRDLGGL